MEKIIVARISLVILMVFLFLSTASAVTPEVLNLELLKRSTLDLIRAIEIATERIPGQPIEAHLESKAKRQEPVFKVTILKSRATEIAIISIDGKTGRVIEITSLPRGTSPSFQAEGGIPIAPIEKGAPAVEPLEKSPAPMPIGEKPTPAEE